MSAITSDKTAGLDKTAGRGKTAGLGRPSVVEPAEQGARLVDRHAPSGTASARRPYRKPVRRTWFMKTHEYRAYALREFSSVVVGFFVFDLVVGLVSLNRGLASWESWVSMQTRPVNLVLTALAVVMSLVHATTWFQATPKIIKIRRGPRYVADGWVVAQHYVLLVAFGAVMYFWLGGL